MTLSHFQAIHAKYEMTLGIPQGFTDPRPTRRAQNIQSNDKHQRSQVWAPASLYQALGMQFSDQPTINPYPAMLTFSLRFTSPKSHVFFCSVINFPCPPHSDSSQCVPVLHSNREPTTSPWSEHCNAKVNDSGDMTLSTDHYGGSCQVLHYCTLSVVALRKLYRVVWLHQFPLPAVFHSSHRDWHPDNFPA